MDNKDFKWTTWPELMKHMPKYNLESSFKLAYTKSSIGKTLVFIVVDLTYL